MSKTYMLARDGQRPLRFTGTLLAAADDHGRERNRYHTLAIYQVARSGEMVVHIHYVTQWQGEACHDLVAVCLDMNEAIRLLERFDPCAWVEGFKGLMAHNPHSSEHYLPRQDNLEQQIRHDYQTQLADLCRTLDIHEDLDQRPDWRGRSPIPEADLTRLLTCAVDRLLEAEGTAGLLDVPGIAQLLTDHFGREIHESWENAQIVSRNTRSGHEIHEKPGNVHIVSREEET